MVNKKILTIVAVAIVVVAAAGVGLMGSEADEGKDAIKIAVVKHNFEPLFIAEHLGLFDAMGVDVELVSVDSGSLSASALASGNVDLAGFGSDPFLSLIDQYDDEYQFVGRYMLDEGLKGAAASNSDIRLDGQKTLIGEKVGVNTKVSYYSLLLKYLDLSAQEYVLLDSIDDEVIADKVNIVHVESGTPMSSALTSGKVDIIVAGATNIAVVEANPDKYRYVYAADEYISYMPVGLFASKATIAERGDDILKVLQAIQLACDIMTPSENGSTFSLRYSCEICSEKLGVSNMNVMERYITTAEWCVEFTDEDVDSINDSFKYIARSNPGKFTGHLKGLETIDCTKYMTYTFVDRMNPASA